MLEKYKKYLISGGIVIFIIITFISYVYVDKNDDLLESVEQTSTTTELIKKNFYVDVKGAVQKPGVYKFKDGDRVTDAINKAEGLSKNGNTSNINLSKKLTSEMVVYIYTNSEIKNGAKALACNTSCNCETINVDNCYEEEKTNNKINLNTATKEELLTLPGIGESKAKAIINYREINGNFQSIEDLTNVSGIGTSTFENLKEYISI